MSVPPSDNDEHAHAKLTLRNFTPHRLNVLARIVSDGFVNSYAQEAATFGIGPPEWRIISFLGEQLDLPQSKKGMTARDIGARTFMQKVQVSRAILKLENKRLIMRRINLEDRREVFLKLTAAGVRIYQAIVPIALTYQGELTRGLTSGDLARLDGIMETLQRNAKRLLEQTGAPQDGETEE